MLTRTPRLAPLRLGLYLAARFISSRGFAPEFGMVPPEPEAHRQELRGRVRGARTALLLAAIASAQ